MRMVVGRGQPEWAREPAGQMAGGVTSWVKLVTVMLGR
jgi:hypothetical protein